MRTTAAVLWTLALIVAGCAGPAPEPAEPQPAEGAPAAGGPSAGGAPDEGAWTATEIAVLDGFATPESVQVDPATGGAWVSNIATETEGYWEADGTGSIARLSAEPAVETQSWRTGEGDAALNAPKGLTLHDGTLYVADLTRVVAFDPGGEADGRVVEVAGAKMLNDTATDGTSVYVSDTATGRIHRIVGPGSRMLNGPTGVNGIAFHKGMVYAVSWDLHEVFEMDAGGAHEPKPLGLADHFTALDGIVILDDGTLLVSDFRGNKVAAIDPVKKTVRTLIELESPADLGLDRKRMRLYVPQFLKDKVVVYRLERK